MRRNLLAPTSSPRMRSVVLRGALALLIVSTPLLLPVVTPGLGPVALGAPDDEAELEWRKSEGQETFDRAKTEYEAGEFEKAFESFKEARKLAKGRRTKAECDRWAYGAQGGHELSELKKRLEEGKESAVYELASKNVNLYAETPIGEEYKKFVDEVEKRLFVVLEDFERVSPRYSEKYGKKFVEEPDKVKQGKRSLEWAVDDKTYLLKVEGLPRDLEKYETGAVVLWLCFDKGSGPYDLIFNVPGTDRSNSGNKIDKAFIKQMKAHRGWKKIVIPFKEFHAQGDPEWGLVRDFRIQFTGRQKFTCWVDGIMIKK